MKRTFFLLAAAMMWAAACWADSPLTSCDFGDAYNDDATVMRIMEQQGGVADGLKTSTMEFLADPKVNVAQRMAVVNKIGWNFDGLSNGKQFFEYLKTRFKVKDEKGLLKKIDASTLSVYAYTLAMSNYFVVEHAQELAHEAVKKDKVHSFTIAFIASLIDAQHHLHNDWSMVYSVVANVINDGSLRVDMRQEAIDIVMEYIDLYKKY